ncbi:MAG: DMT family transporter [Clostridiales bacterium]|uniref:DMT family transporter n=1 Tax=Zhenhengia yiwuensis TaxID=2763666 RepID=A0A926EJY9_9FIRM|nr:DMT family transporter [Zhenhengia yiwuensis]MBC8580979.1 DMT family transporter [Zhenhengia yiwuensis]MDU6358900.1 DMT family transporter [Clostridiales bacterium]
MNQKYKGILYIVLSAFSFAFMNAFVRLAGDLPSIQKSFFRNLVALIFAAIVLKRSKIGFSYKKENLKPLILRSIFGTLGILCNFYAIDKLVLADASMLNKMSPFFAILFSYLLLKEKIDWVQAISVAGAFVGSLFIIKPSFHNVELIPALAGFAGGMAAGAAYTFVRILGQKGEKGPFIVFFFSSFSCVATLPFLIFQYHAMSLTQVIYLLLAGLAAAGGQFAITAAYCYAPAKEISIYDYSQIIFSAILGFFLFGQIPDFYSGLGYVIICGMAIFMFLYNTGKLKIGVNK